MSGRHVGRDRARHGSPGRQPSPRGPLAQLAHAALDCRLDRRDDDRQLRVASACSRPSPPGSRPAQVRRDAEVGHRGEVGVAQPVVPAVQVAAVLVAHARLDRARRRSRAPPRRRRSGVAYQAGPVGRLALRRERAGQQSRRSPVLAIHWDEVDQPRAGQLRVEHRARGRASARRGRRSARWRRRRRPCSRRCRPGAAQCTRRRSSAAPSRTPPRTASPPGPRRWKRGRSSRSGCPSGASHGGAVHRVLAQRAGVVLGVPLAVGVRPGRPGRRVQRGHQLQAGHGGGAARRHHPGRVHAQHAGEFRRRELPGSPQCRVSSAFQDGMHSCTQARSEPLAGR